MPPIITIDTSPSTHYIDAHHSTNQLTTLLLNDQLILVEIQGTLEYNKAKGEHDGPIKLGDISWDEPTARGYLHIGHHRMVGRLQVLKTPLAVFTDSPIPTTEYIDDKEWQLHTIIRKKLVFDVRPEPVFPDQTL